MLIGRFNEGCIWRCTIIRAEMLSTNLLFFLSTTCEIYKTPFERFLFGHILYNGIKLLLPIITFPIYILLRFKKQTFSQTEKTSFKEAVLYFKVNFCMHNLSYLSYACEWQTTGQLDRWRKSCNWWWYFEWLCFAIFSE